MYIFQKGQVCDLKTRELTELLEMLDQKLSSLILESNKSEDSDALGLYDRAEYFIGIGFVAMQQYIADTMFNSKVSKKNALNLGNKSPKGIPYIAIINFAANWWKHEAEWDWFGEGEIDQQTFKDVLNVSGSVEYPLSNILSHLCSENELSLSLVIPKLESWRDEFIKYRQNQCNNNQYT
ncbi:hypothetical protein [Aliivibrio sp. 1S128]|uniref:hypothetical protein n=1 Tax=Aliivibrio sp. 1S128 TaxID=1840085 RepID=UPI00080E7214|nr:hypothetical protein [Aliivibrio sp. 1S128]OCH13422.1 hypothetical protein A6E03_18390 [Aliivibrio sp. 1S128]